MKNFENEFNKDELNRDKPLFKIEGEKEGINLATIIDSESIVRNVFKSNPDKGFELLFKRYYKPLRNHAVRFVYSKELAEDIVIEVFVNFWKKKHYENVNISYRAYLYQAVRNTIYNHLKSEFGKKNNYGLYVDIVGKDKELEFDTPQRILLFDELFNKIEKSVERFPPQCQKVFILSRFEGKKNREIADELNIKIKTVEAHMMKALSILKNSLTDYLN